MDELNLDDLSNGRIPGISQRLGGSLAEAGSVCLESEGHAQGVQLTVRGDVNNRYSVRWHPVDDQAHRAWGDPAEATEYGAAGIAALLTERELPYTIIERSVKDTGFDYWLGDGASDLPMERVARLEVSGIRHGDSSRIRARVREKLKQMGRSDDMLLPAYAIVVEFGNPLAEVRKKDE